MDLFQYQQPVYVRLIIYIVSTHIVGKDL